MMEERASVIERTVERTNVWEAISKRGENPKVGHKTPDAVTDGARVEYDAYTNAIWLKESEDR